MTDFLVAIGLLFVIEGVVCAGAPNSVKRAAAAMLEAPEATLRIVGLVSAVIGLAIIWLMRG